MSAAPSGRTSTATPPPTSPASTPPTPHHQEPPEPKAAGPEADHVGLLGGALRVGRTLGHAADQAEDAEVDGTAGEREPGEERERRDPARRRHGARDPPGRDAERRGDRDGLRQRAREHRVATAPGQADPE